jgi:hypothetical protein
MSDFNSKPGRVGRPTRAVRSASALASVDWEAFDAVAVLRRIAADASAPASARVAACKALIAAGDGNTAADTPADRPLDRASALGVRLLTRPLQ